MKKLKFDYAFQDIKEFENIIFDCSNEKILEFVKSNMHKLQLNEEHSCGATIHEKWGYDGNDSILITGDEDYMSIDIANVKIIK